MSFDTSCYQKLSIVRLACSTQEPLFYSVLFYSIVLSRVSLPMWTQMWVGNKKAQKTEYDGIKW